MDIKLTKKERELIEFIRNQKPTLIMVDIYGKQPISFSIDENCNRNREYEKTREKVIKKISELGTRLYKDFYSQKNRLLDAYKKNYELHLSKKFRLVIIKNRIQCPYYLYCLAKTYIYIPVVPGIQKRMIRIWESKYGNSFIPSRAWFNFPELPDVIDNMSCSSCRIHCEICNKELMFEDTISHHLSYSAEAVPSEDNLDWIKYYSLVCRKCHGPLAGTVPGRDKWNQVVKEELKRRELS